MKGTQKFTPHTADSCNFICVCCLRASTWFFAACAVVQDTLQVQLMMHLHYGSLIQKHTGEGVISQDHSYSDYTLLQRNPIIILIRHPLSKPSNHVALQFMWTACVCVCVGRICRNMSIKAKTSCTVIYLCVCVSVCCRNEGIVCSWCAVSSVTVIVFVMRWPYYRSRCWQQRYAGSLGVQSSLCSFFERS